jgi:hypothetical protein
MRRSTSGILRFSARSRRQDNLRSAFQFMTGIWLVFSSEQQLRQSIIDAGFSIERVHGGWRGEAVGSGDGELIFVARRP